MISIEQSARKSTLLSYSTEIHTKVQKFMRFWGPAHTVEINRDTMASAASIYNAPDGSFVKAVRQAGSGFYTPTEGSQCTLTVSLVAQEAPEPLNLDGVLGNERQIVIGEGDSDVRDVIDKCVMTMQQAELAGLLFPVLDGRVVKGKDTQAATFVTLEITLLNFTRECLWELEPRRKLQYAQGHKDQGSVLFKKGNKEAAFNRYVFGLKYLLSMTPTKAMPSDMQQDHGSLRNQLYLNIAACQLFYENYDAVIVNCSKALDEDPSNVKGLYRRGVAFSRKRDWENADLDLCQVVRLEKGNKAALRELQTVQHMLREEKEQDKLGQLARGMKQMFS